MSGPQISSKRSEALANALKELASFEEAGEKHANEKIVPSGQRKCPITGETMQCMRKFGITIDVSPGHGIWLDQGELAAILLASSQNEHELDARPEAEGGASMSEQTDAQSLVSALSELASTKSVGDHGNEKIIPTGERKCPISGETMHSIKKQGYTIDVSPYGVWLDEGELASMMHAASQYEHELEATPDAEGVINVNHSSDAQSQAVRAFAQYLGKDL